VGGKKLPGNFPGGEKRQGLARLPTAMRVWRGAQVRSPVFLPLFPFLREGACEAVSGWARSLLCPHQREAAPLGSVLVLDRWGRRKQGTADRWLRELRPLRAWPLGSAGWLPYLLLLPCSFL
jgi:hypothetical protein